MKIFVHADEILDKEWTVSRKFSGKIPSRWCQGRSFEPIECPYTRGSTQKFRILDIWWPYQRKKIFVTIDDFRLHSQQRMERISNIFRENSKLVVSRVFFRTHKLVLCWWLRPETSKFEFPDPFVRIEASWIFKPNKAPRCASNWESGTNLYKTIFLREKNNNKNTLGESNYFETGAGWSLVVWFLNSSTLCFDFLVRL